MNSSTEINELAAALVAAQSEFTPALKTSVNPHFKSKYADLETAISAAQPALLKHGIAVLQGSSGDVLASSISITTRLLHKSGQWIEDTLTLPAANRGNFDAQSVGSAITYGRRYSYMAMLGIAAEDDDGNSSVIAERETHPPMHHKIPSAVRYISQPQQSRLFALATKGHKSVDDVKRELLRRSIDSSATIPSDLYQDICDWAEGA
jgi:hypothetical protein